MKKKQEEKATKEEPFGSSESRREMEKREEVFGSTYVTQEDMYRIVCGVRMLSDGLMQERLVTLRERGVEIQMLAHRLDELAQRIKNIDGKIVLQLKQTHWQAASGFGKDR